MIDTTKERIRTDRAWNRLCSRLREDELPVEAGGTSKTLPVEAGGTVNALPVEVGGTGKRKVFLKWGTVAAAAVVACILSVSYFVPGGGIADFKVVRSENREASTLVTTLEDGSIVFLTQEASLQYPEHFAADKREVNLAGDAFFDIAQNRSCPFLIETEEVRVEVLGTAFDVRSDGKSPFSLSVKRGCVKVSSKQGGGEVYVKAGQNVTLQAHRLLLGQNKDEEAWDRYTQRMRFKDERLVNILRVVNREAAELQLQTESPELGERKLTIEITDSSPQAVAQLVCLALNLRTTRQGSALILSE